MCDSSYTYTTQTQSIIQSIWSITIKINIGNIPICGEEENEKGRKERKIDIPYIEGFVWIGLDVLSTQFHMFRLKIFNPT